MARNIIDSVTRLAQMHEHTQQQLAAMNDEWNRLYNHAAKELKEFRIGLDDLAGMLGIIEPQTQMPMLPPRDVTGPQPTFTITDTGDEFR